MIGAGFEPLDLLWLLLPLAAASGWIMAKRDMPRERAHRKDLPADYFRSINFLLNEQPDKAIEVFTQMVEVNTETVETHLALGSLFRRRGEVERAIRIHQNLMARPNLDPVQRGLALCELAQDYHKAGLLDRAENLFLELAETHEHGDTALAALMQIYELEKEWDKALAVGRRLAQRSTRPLGNVLAQYCCEQAELAMRAGQGDQARRALDRALAYDRTSTRARLLAGRWAAARGELRDAIGLWQQIEQQDAEALDEVIDDIASAYARLGDLPALRDYLTGLMQRRPGAKVLLALTEVIRQQDGLAAAQSFLGDQLKRAPSVPALRWLVEQSMHGAGSGAPLDLGLLAGVLDRLSLLQEGYQCQQCGYRGQGLHWQCPACHAWDAMRSASCSPGAPQTNNPGDGTSPTLPHTSSERTRH